MLTVGEPFLIRRQAMKTTKNANLVLAVFVFLCATVSGAEQWNGNGHYYETVHVPAGINWLNAKAAAGSRTYMGRSGHLATITSAGENSFIFDNLLAADKNPQSRRYWLGGFQSPFPGGDWQWITGEAWSYTNWWVTEPSGDGDALEIFSSSAGVGHGRWNDLPATFEIEMYNAGYIVEYPEPSESQPTGWWDDDWAYRKQVSITNNVDAILYDYSVNISVDTASLISQGKMQGDCGDIRIVENGEVISHGIQNCNSADTQIYFIANDLAIGVNTDIYIYYGNSGAENGFVDNWKDAFYIWWDDFDSDRGWYDLWGRGVTYNVNDGYITVYFSPYQDGAIAPADGSSFPKNNRVGMRTEARMMVLNSRWCQAQISLDWKYSIANLSVGHSRYNIAFSDLITRSLSTNTWYTYETVYNRLTGDWWGTINGERVSGNRPALPTDDLSEITLADCNGNNARVDYVYLRYFIEPEPIYALGAEERESDTGPVAYWSFDNPDDPGHDDSGNGHDGAVDGAAWEDGALRFDGMDDYVLVPDNDILDIGTVDLTIAMYVKTPVPPKDPASTNGTGLIGKRNEQLASSAGYSIKFNEVSQGHAVLALVGDGTGEKIRTDGLAAVYDGTWHHVAIVFDRDSYCQIYIDGVPDGEAMDISSRQGSIANGLDLLIGAQHVSGGIVQYFNGVIDEVRIYQQALSEREIADLAGELFTRDMWFVDDDGPHDPGPDNPDVSDPSENGTGAHPFDSIQEAVDAASDGQQVLVRPGLYSEEVVFKGKAITVRGIEGAPILEAPDAEAVLFYYGEGPDSVLKNFIIRNSYTAVFLAGSSPTISNVTIVDNIFGVAAYGDSDPDIASSIFWNSAGADMPGCRAAYSRTDDLGDGRGNITDDPMFADPDNGDYHLRSQRGRYWPQLDMWVLDDVTSPCIDAGDPAVNTADEPEPNGRRINMGAFGGTEQAGLSPDEPQCEGDFNDDGWLSPSDVSILVNRLLPHATNLYWRECP